MDVLGQLNAEEEARKQIDAMKGELIMQGLLIKPSGRFGSNNPRYVSLYEPGIIQRSKNIGKEDGKMIDLKNFIIKPETMIIYNEEKKSIILKTIKKDEKDTCEFIEPPPCSEQVTRKSTQTNGLSNENESQKNLDGTQIEQTTDIQKWFEVITELRNGIRDKALRGDSHKTEAGGKNSKINKHQSAKDGKEGAEEGQQDLKLSSMRNRISGSYKNLKDKIGKKGDREDWEMVDDDIEKGQEGKQKTSDEKEASKKPSGGNEDIVSNKQYIQLSKQYNKLQKTHAKLDSDFSKLSKKCQEMEDNVDSNKNLHDKINNLEQQLDENSKYQEQESIMLNDYQISLQEKQQKNAVEYQRSLTFIQSREQANSKEIGKLKQQNDELNEKLERKRLYLSNYKDLVQENRSLKKMMSQLQNKTITDEAKKYTLAGEYKNKAMLSHQELTEHINKLYKQDIIKRMEIIQWMQNDFDQEMKMNVNQSFIKPIQIELQMKIKQVFIEQIKEPKKIQIVLWNDKKSYKSSHYKINPETHQADIGQKFEMNTALDFDTEQYKFISIQPQCILILLQFAETNEIIGSLNFDLSKCAKSSSHTDNYVTTTLDFDSEKYKGSNVKIKFKLQILEDLPQYNDASGSYRADIDSLLHSISYPPINILKHQESVGKVVTSAIEKLENNIQNQLVALYKAMSRADSSYFLKEGEDLDPDGKTKSYESQNSRLLEVMTMLRCQIPEKKIPLQIKDMLKEFKERAPSEVKVDEIEFEDKTKEERKLNVDTEDAQEQTMTTNAGETDMLVDPKFENIPDLDHFSTTQDAQRQSTSQVQPQSVQHAPSSSFAGAASIFTNEDGMPRPSFKQKIGDIQKAQVHRSSIISLKQKENPLEDLSQKIQSAELFNCIKFAQTPLQKVKRVKSQAYRVNDQAMQIWEAQGPLHFELLYKDVSIQLTSSLVNLIYQECKVDGREAIFIGQNDKNNQPNGFVRIIFKLGQIYEGTVLNNSKQGWGRFIESNSCKIGYWKNGQLHGNSYCFQWTNNPDEDGCEELDGWYENGKHTGEKNNFKHDTQYPFWNYKKDYFLEQHKKVHIAYTIVFNMKEGFNLEENKDFSKIEDRVFDPSMDRTSTPAGLVAGSDAMKGQQDAIYDKIIKYKEVILKHDKALQEVIGKSVVMAIGATGVGKSTLMNALIQGNDNMDLNDDCDIVANQQLTYRGEVVFEIGHGTKSCTETPGFYPFQNMYFLDCPGLQDQDKLKEYPNQTAVHYVQKNASACVVLLIISPDQFVNRGAVMITQLTGVLRQISSGCSKQRISEILFPLIVQYKATVPQRIRKDLNNIIEALKKKYHNNDPDYENIFDGPRFPQSDEVDQIIEMIEVVMDNYTCVDPLDTSSSKFTEKEKTCEQVMKEIQRRFEDEKYGQPKDFNDDLPLQLSELLDTELFEKLLDAKNFQSTKALRDEVEVIFDPILLPWKGRNKSDCIQLLNDKIAIADAAGKDAVLQWYITKVSSIFKDQAAMEGKTIKEFRNGNTSQYPIIHWLQYVTETHSIVNEEHRTAFNYKMWRDSLEWFIRAPQTGQLDNLEKQRLLYQMSSSTEMVSFVQAIQKLLDAEKINGWDDDIKNSWAKLGFDEFLHHFKEALPKTYPLRFFKSQEVLFKFDRPVAKSKYALTPQTSVTNSQSGVSPGIFDQEESQNLSLTLEHDQVQTHINKKM